MSRLLLLLSLLLLLVEGQQKHKSLGKSTDHFRRQSCDGRGPVVNDTSPAHISDSACCSGQIEILLRDAMGNPDERLGDTARSIQRRVQERFGHSFEVIISRGDFSVSSHYHGLQLCKIQNGEFFMLAYKTPIDYNVDDLPEEARMAAIDAQEELGSTPEDDRGHFPDNRFNPLAGEDPAIQSPPRTARAATFNAKFGNNTEFKQGTAINEADGAGGAVCTRGQVAGDKCCSGAMFKIMESVLNELSTSPEFDSSEKSPGVTANVMKRRMQQKFGRVFEVIVSNSEFEHTTYQVGDLTCKFESHGLHVLAYETPHQDIVRSSSERKQRLQYNPFNLQSEAHFSSHSDREPLGTSDLQLPRQMGFSKDLELETEGDRAGFPKGSHCEAGTRTGSGCCNLALFEAMYSTVRKMQGEDTFNQFDRRVIASELKGAAEGATGMPMEVLVANDDFVVSSHADLENSCKFRVDHYWIMAWQTPAGGYSVGQDFYADNGFTSKLSCGGLDAEGSSCCSPELRFTMLKAVDDTSNNQYNRMNTDAVSRAVVRAAQQRFNTQMNAIVSRADFIWLHADGSVAETSPLVCKVDIFNFHVLTFEAGTGPSSPVEFLTGDVVSVDPEPVLQQIPPPQLVQQFIAPQPVQSFAQQIPIPQQIPQFIQNVPQIIQPQVVAQPDLPVVQPPIYTPPAASFCFSEDTWVQTPTGKKNMAQLEIGDYVLTANQTHAYYAPVTVWMHRNPEKFAHFFTFMTEYGKMLRMTAKHFIYRNKCDENYKEYVKILPASGEEIFASELKTGDCLLLLYRGQWRQQRIKEITRTKRKGIYAPLTSNGRIIVNDILASCYSDVKGQTLQSTYFEAISLMRQAYYGFKTWISEKNIELPFSTDLWRDVLSLILPN